MTIDSININKTNNHLSSSLIGGQGGSMS